MAKTRLNATGLVGALILVSTAVHAQAPSPFHLQETTIDQIRGALTAGRITCRELIGHYLKRVDAAARLQRSATWKLFLLARAK